MSALNFNTYNPIRPFGHNFANVIGQRFTRVQVIALWGRTKNNNINWLCLCKCGGLTVLSTATLRSRNSVSCGCKLREIQQRGNYKHGEQRNGRETVELRAYREARRRCRNPNRRFFENYGGRGIKFLYESFGEFLADIGRRPTSAHSLDRIDVNGHYEPGNCRWATTREQSWNKRNSIMITIDGRTQALGAWCAEYKILHRLVYTRIYVRNWDVKRALTTPKQINQFM